jgi:hypothetical protein
MLAQTIDEQIQKENMRERMLEQKLQKTAVIDECDNCVNIRK